MRRPQPILRPHSPRACRGDTVHPSTLDVLDELHLEDAIAQMQHRDVTHFHVSFADGTYRVADFSRLHVAHPYIRFMPQWDFLTVLAEEAKTLSTFRLLFRHEATDLCRDGRIVVGVNAKSPGGDVRIRATLTVAADGRGSVIRNHSDLAVHQFSAPMDVLWFRVSRSAGGRARASDVGRRPWRLLADRLRSPQGTDKELRAGDIRDLRRAATDLMPALKSRIDEVRSWDEVETLTVQMDRLQRWHQPGLLCIGDAAHAMSPIGGVGINLVVQDAVAAGRMRGEPLRTGQLTSRTLAAIQRRRQLPTAAT